MVSYMEEKIIIAGFGGQGIMFLGKLICQAGMEEGYNVTFMPSYGAEVRGGTANCHVIISDSSIASPVITEATTLLIFNDPSLLKFEKNLVPDGFLLYNSSLVNVKPARKDIEISSVPATETAYKAGSTKSTNMVMLGRYAAYKKILSREKIIKNIKGISGEINLKAFDAGYRYER